MRLGGTTDAFDEEEDEEEDVVEMAAELSFLFLRPAESLPFCSKVEDGSTREGLRSGEVLEDFEILFLWANEFETGRANGSASFAVRSGATAVGGRDSDREGTVSERTRVWRS